MREVGEAKTETKKAKRAREKKEKKEKKEREKKESAGIEEGDDDKDKNEEGEGESNDSSSSSSSSEEEDDEENEDKLNQSTSKNAYLTLEQVSLSSHLSLLLRATSIQDKKMIQPRNLFLRFTILVPPLPPCNLYCPCTRSKLWRSTRCSTWAAVSKALAIIRKQRRPTRRWCPSPRKSWKS